MPSGKAITTPLHLYRFLLRQCKKLPKNAEDYYRHQIRQSFNSHADENSAERIQQIIKRAVEDSEWVVKQDVHESEYISDPSLVLFFIASIRVFQGT